MTGNTLRIGIDISTLLNHGCDIGAGRYIINLIKNLLKIDSSNTYILTARYTTDEYLPVIEELKYQNQNKLKLKLFKTTQKKLDLWNRLRFPPIEFLGFKADMLHCPDFLIPPTLNKNIILTIHDLAFIRFPEFYFDWFVRKYTKEVSSNTRLARKIIADSESTKNDITSFLKINPEKIEAILLAADDIFKKLADSEKNINVLKRYGIDKKYILSVGTIEPRKNFVTLIKAFNLLKGNNKSIPNFDYKLVIVGKTGWKSEQTFREWNCSQFKEDILFLGRIPDNDLLQIYNQAELFVYPSFFEGFGLPVVEAMKCRLPVIASNSSSIPEITGDSDLLLDPHNPQEFADKIFITLKDEAIKNKLKIKSLNHAEKFSWELTAEKTLQIYNQIIFSR